jgi:hypothetical protein
MTDTTTIRRRPDGSIDTAFYVAAVRARRSEAAHGMVGAAAGAARGPLLGLVALLALLPFLGSKG